MFLSVRFRCRNIIYQNEYLVWISANVRKLPIGIDWPYLSNTGFQSLATVGNSCHGKAIGRLKIFSSYFFTFWQIGPIKSMTNWLSSSLSWMYVRIVLLCYLIKLKNKPILLEPWGTSFIRFSKQMYVNVWVWHAEKPTLHIQLYFLLP